MKATERQIQETIARCVSIMVYFHNEERTPKVKAMMIAEVQTVVGFVGELGLGLGSREVEERIVIPVEGELLTRYGHEVGRRLNAEFVSAFGDTRNTDPAQGPMLANVVVG